MDSRFLVSGHPQAALREPLLLEVFAKSLRASIVSGLLPFPIAAEQ